MFDEDTNYEEPQVPGGPAGAGADVPEIPLEDYEVPAEDKRGELGLANTYTGSVEFGVLGSGQCGGRLAHSFHSIGYRKTLAINTAAGDLETVDLPPDQKLRIGDQDGSGKDMGKGAKAVKDAYQEVFDAMKSVFGVVDKIVICAGAGGGTGSGSLETLVDLAASYLKHLHGGRDCRADVVLVVALPTAGERRSERVAQNLRKVSGVLDQLVTGGLCGPVFLVDNSKIEQMYRGIPPTKFWSLVNSTISNLFHTFNQISTQPSEFMTFDSSDYRDVLSTPGYAVMGVTKLAGEKLSKALQDNFKKTLLYGDSDFKTAHKAACIVSSGSAQIDSISMDDINYGFDTVHNLLGEATVFRGLIRSSGDGVRAFTLVTGLAPAKTEVRGVYDE